MPDCPALLRRSALVAVVALGLVAPVGGSAATALPQPTTAAAAVVDEPPALDTVTAQPLPTWQTNGVVYAIETVGNVVYAGGNFSSVRPPGAAPGSQEVARKNIAAFNATTGELLPFSHSFKSPDLPIPTGGYDKTCSPGSTSGTYTCDTVYEIRASRDASKIYVGGDFTRVDGLARGNMAAFSTTNNSLLPWRVTGIQGRVRSLAVSNDTVYFGGSFTQADGQPRSRLAAADASTGALREWAPTADKLVIAMALSADDSRVILGGQFDNINGAPMHGLAAVAATGAGASTRWDSNAVPSNSYITDLSVSGDTVFASANGEGGGVFDGRLAAKTHTGELVWQDVCLGATWAIEVAGPLVYSGSHAHDCSRTSGGFPESWNVPPPAPRRYYRLLAQTKEGGYAPHIQHWFPTTNGGIVGKLGPRDLTWTGQQVWVAGEFTTVNNAPQQGLTRFGPAPAYVRAAPLRPDAPTASSVRPGEVRLSWRATEDLDDAHLTYTVLRGPNTGSMTAIGTVKASSKPWLRPSVRFTDTGLNPGQSYVYQVQAADPSGRTSPRSYSSSVTVATTVEPYADAVLASDPSMYWRLNDPAGSTTVRPAVGSGGTAAAGVTFGVPGATPEVDPSNTAVRTTGTSTSTIGSTNPEAGPDVFSAEVWFRTTSTSGGKIFGFGNSQLGSSGSYDRHAYMHPDGRVTFGVHPGGVRTITSSRAYNDGKWHSLVATLNADGMKLFVDGAAVASRSDVTTGQSYVGYWRLGGDNNNGWPSAGSGYFTGDLDEFAVYDRALSSQEVVAHRVAGAPDREAPSTPVLTSAAAGGRTVVLQWNESTDDTAIARYEVHRVASSSGTPTASTLVGSTSGLTWTSPNTPSGTSYWRIIAVDGAGNRSAPSQAGTVTVSGAQPYAEAVLADGAELYWRLSDGVGSTSASAVVGPQGNPGAGASFGGAGALDGDTAVRTDGSGTGLVVSTGQVTGPRAFTTEAWFRTSSTRGGKIIGFGNAATGTSSNYDRHVYMRDDGTLRFGVWLGYVAAVESPRAYNDGQWHHLAASLGPAGLVLSVDGATVASNSGINGAQDYAGYWRIGGDRTWGGASSDFFAGDIDEFAVYPHQLTPTQIARHVSAGSSGGADVQAPTAPQQVTTDVSGTTVDVSWQASSDDTAVTSYHVHRGTTVGFEPTAATLVASEIDTSATETSVPEGTWYYRVIAMDEAGNASAPSDGARAVVSLPDTQAPTAPTNLRATVAGADVTLSWSAASDNVGVTEYIIHRATTSGFTPSASTAIGEATALTFTDVGRPVGDWYYRVVAVDGAMNAGPPSGTAAATVSGPATPVQIVLAPSADAWIDESVPTRNYGNAWALTTDGSPLSESWLKFTLPTAPAGQSLTRAVLRVRTSTQSWSGSVGAILIHSGDNAWIESGLTWGTRPAVGTTELGRVPAGQTSDTTYEVELAVDQVAAMLNRDASFVLGTANRDGAQIVSREGAAAGRPQLILTFS